VAASQSRRFIPPWKISTFVHHVMAVGDIERHDGEPPALDNPGIRTQLVVNAHPTTKEDSRC
jgi:hypothetical protein